VEWSAQDSGNNFTAREHPNTDPNSLHWQAAFAPLGRHATQCRGPDASAKTESGQNWVQVRVLRKCALQMSVLRNRKQECLHNTEGE
jgi:hypothetical protein